MVDKLIDNTGALGQVVIDCPVGERVRICHNLFHQGVDDADKVRGFRLSNDEIGELSEVSDSWNCVNYFQKNAGVQVIEFIEDMSRNVSYIQISGNLQVHDHASIPQGGPAYATYYSEIED